MIKPSLPHNENERLAALRSYQVLDTAREPAFDDLVMIARAICGTQMGAVTLIDADRQWFKALQGTSGEQTPRSESFCAHAIVDPSRLLVVEDALLDERFHDHPAVLGEPHVRFYAGAPLLSSDGYALGTLCVFDSSPHEVTAGQREGLWALARQVGRLLEMRRLAARLCQLEDERRLYEQQLHHYQHALELANAELHELSSTDALTGLPNRRSVSLELSKRLQRGAPWVSAVALVDVDHFKQINDRYGHAEGDRVLLALAELFRAHRRDDEVIARYGGEEFVFVLDARDAEHALTRCEQLRAAVERMPWEISVTVSIGVALHASGESYASLMQRADAALYRAKREGRNRTLMADD